MAAPTDGSVDLNSINMPTIMISSSDGNHLNMIYALFEIIEVMNYLYKMELSNQ